MLQFNKIAAYLLLFLNVLIVFLLIFESNFVLPQGLTPLGRFHPLLLHIPIGFSVFLVLFNIFKKEIAPDSFQKINLFLFNLTALSTAIVALLGFFLSKESGFDANNLQIHKYSGIFLSLFTFALCHFYNNFQIYKNSSAAWAILAIIAFAGHFGAVLTHGENYILGSAPETKPQFTANNSLFEASVYPILQAKCLSCHNDKKTKGQLNISTIALLLKGGKNGPIYKAGDTLNSHILQRVNLPLDDKKHMPPKGKPQLSPAEIAIITNWIAEGADLKKAIKDYEQKSEVKQLAINTISQISVQNSEKTYNFSEASQTTIEAVNTPFCTVVPIANNGPALEANFFVSNKFDAKNLENLSKMPLKDEHLKLISKYQNLEKLLLNQTDITGKTLSELSQNKNLKSLALSGTKISKTSLEKLLSNTSLSEIFLWNTPISGPEIDQLSKIYPKIRFEKGAIPNLSEKLKLNKPTLVNEEFIVKNGAKIELKHSLKNVNIHYTLDGTEPDSTTTTIYQKPIAVSRSIYLKAIGTKEGWLASQVVSKYFYRSSFLPDTVFLLTKPDPKYGKDGGKALFDLKKGTADNNTSNWLGYRETNFEAIFQFKKTQIISSITLSFMKNISSYIMPPTSVEIWGGNEKNNLKLIQKTNPTQAKLGEPAEVSGLDFNILPGNYQFIKIIAKPLPVLPAWHQGKGQKGWVFIDEVLFN